MCLQFHKKSMHVGIMRMDKFHGCPKRELHEVEVETSDVVNECGA